MSAFTPHESSREYYALIKIRGKQIKQSQRYVSRYSPGVRPVNCLNVRAKYWLD